MHDAQVQEMQTYMAGKYLQGKPEKQLRLSEVLRRRKKARAWQKLPEKAALITALIILPLTHLTRGYLGFGGEWLVIGGVYLAAVQIRRWKCGRP